MPVDHSDELPRDRAPTTYQDRTIFPPPQTVLVEPASRSRGGLMAFLLMLIPCGLLGYFAYTQSAALASAQEQLAMLRTTIEAETTDQLAEKDEVIQSLREQVAQLQSQVDADDELARLIGESGDKLQEIEEMLAGPKRGWGTLERRAEWAMEPPAWNAEAMTILQAHVDRLEELRKQIRDWQPPRTSRPGPGEILPGGQD